MLSKDLVFLDVEHETSDEFLNSISDELLEKGYVKESFKDAILKREEEYPTAIGTEKYNLAIPHTDSEHVNKPGVAFVRLKKECKFKEMCTNNDINVNMAFVLLDKDPSEIVKVLNNKIL